MKEAEVNHYQSAVTVSNRKLSIVGKSICIGIAAGVVVTLYRLLLMKAEELSTYIYRYVTSHLLLLPILFVCLGALGFLTGKLVKRHKAISGSGIPQVKGILMGSYQAPWLSTLAAKFFGGAAAILGGLSLGREGPSIQLGSCVAEGVAGKIAASRTEKRVLIAAGASAGLAAAFNAPLAGAMFTIEEIFKYISPLILLSTAASAIAADFISKMVFGLAPVFSFSTPLSIPLEYYWLLLLMGILLGGAGALYNLTLIKTISLYKKPRWLKETWRPVIPFLLAGVLAFALPQVLGGGHVMIEALVPATPTSFLILILIVKFAFSMISFCSGAPGGIFFPMLVLGGAIGALFGKFATAIGMNPALFNNFVIIAMAGYFAAIVRAPLTGVMLLLEMTGSFHNLLPLLAVALTAYITADLLHSRPVYDTLLENLLAGRILDGRTEEDGKITIEIPVHFDSIADGKSVRELGLPKDCLLIAIRREGKDLIPNGDTQVSAEDALVFLVNQKDEASLRGLLSSLAEYQ